LKEGVEDFEDIRLEEDRKVSMAKSKEKNDEGESMTCRENGNLNFPKVFSTKLLVPGSFSIPCIVGKVKIDRGLCGLGVSVSLMPYSVFYKLHLGPLQPAPFSL